ncbi:hypothetical protein HMN09_00631100 [Mycena chlorophos]|uniref:NAD(P)-binding protein n=1 Tax=Mycena chlorophos TaxID=658473 RepID=A0A8H6T4V0_MYCCL|nr:hypothetical protein HMN09_00631100 [Mycena chlorophos]
MLVAGQIVCITGSSRGIGRGCALEFAKYGASGFILHYLGDAVTEQEITTLKQELEAFEHQPKVVVVAGDIGDPATASKIVEAGVGAFQRIDTLVSNAGICPFAEFLTMPHATWERTRQVNLDGSFYIVQSRTFGPGLLGFFNCFTAVANQMKAQTPQGGSIIGISSISALVGGGLQAHYTPTKAGILSLMQSCAVALGKYSIRANAILPGTIATDINKEDLSDASKREYMEQRTCLNRLGEPEDVAGPVVFMASSLAKYVTGAALLVDGGLFVNLQVRICSSSCVLSDTASSNFAPNAGVAKLRSHTFFSLRTTAPLDSMSSKERNGVQLPPASSGDGRSGASSLRAKIAAFESQGAVPAPRGSFGMGAPPEPKPRQRAELYGNVMQPSRLPSATLGLARPVEAFSSLDPRAIALPADDSGLYSEPSSPVARSSLPSDASRIPSNGSGRNPPNPFAFEELMRKARAPETAPVTAAAKAVQEKHRQPAVTTRATDFSKALEKARRAEADAKATRRQSALFLQPQFTGSTLTPQHTGGSGPLSPQHTGGSFIIAPQTTGGSTRPFSPPPLSPLAAYSPPRSPSSPKLTTPTSATRPLSAFFAVEDRPLVAEPQEVDETTEIDPAAPSPHQPLSAEADVPAEQADPSPAPLEEKTPPPTGPPSEPDQTLEEVLEPEAVSLETSEPEPNSVVIQDSTPSPERAEEVASAVDEGNAEKQACVTAATPVETKALESASDDEPHHHPSSPDSFHAGLDLDAHLRRHALTGESHAVQSAFDDDEDEPVYSLGEDELAPLPNNLASHRFRAHLSTITERSIEPGSPSWDVSRFSMASSAWGDRRASRRESDGYGAVFEYIYEGRDVEDEEASGPDLDSPVAAGMAGIGAGANAVVETLESPSAPTPSDSDYVVLRADRRDSTGYKDDGPPSPSPYRLSYLTDRGYTPSLRSEDGDRAEDSGAWPEEQQPEPEVQTPVPANFHPDVSSMDLGPKSPGMDGVFGAPPPAGKDPASPDEAPVADSIRNSFLSTRDSLLSIPRDSMSSTRDSMLSTRDSILSIDSRNSAASAAHAQVVTLRPLSTLSSLDTASPSHVAVAHRIPAVAGVQGFQRGVAVYVPGNLKGSAEEPAPTPRRRNLPLAPRPSTTYEVTPNTTPPRRPALTAAGLPRPHTAYLPDDDDEGGDSLGEFGTISFGTQPHSFSAVVHGRDKSLPPMPMSPGYATGNDLAELMAEAALLEQRLERGELPAEALRRLSRISMRLPPKVPPGPAPPVPPLPLHQQQQNIAPLKPRRSLRNPLSRSRSDRRPAEVQEDVRPLASSSTSNLLSVAPSIEATLPAPEQVVLLRTSTNSSDIPPTPPTEKPRGSLFLESPPIGEHFPQPGCSTDAGQLVDGF